MKELKPLIIALMGTMICMMYFPAQSQVPQSFKYQAVVRDRAGQVLPGQDINLQISILQSNTEGPEVYREMHSVTTSELGMVNIEVGKGISLAGSFAAIDWSAGNYYLRIGMDPAGGTNFELMGFSQLLSVPYALYADKAGSGERTNDYDWQILGPDVVTGHGGSYPAGNVGVGNNAPQTLLYVAKNMGEPTITIRNMGGGGGATYAMVDDLSGANWKFKATQFGGFKIRDQAYGLDVLTMEPNSAANALYINSDGFVGLGTSTPMQKLHVDGYFRLDNTTLYPFMILNLSDLWPDGHTGIVFSYNNSLKGYIYYDNGESLLRLNAAAGDGGRNDLVITSAGKVGLGTPTPASNFHVAESSPGYTATFGTEINNHFTAGTNVSIGDDNAISLLYVGQDIDHKGYLHWTYNATPANALFEIGTYSGLNPLILQSAGGNVGIGTTSPSSRLHVKYDSNDDLYLGFNDGHPAYMYHSESESDGDGQAAIYAFRSRDTQNDGTGYTYYGINSAMMGYSYWGDAYSFGTGGFNYLDFTRCGGVIGAQSYGSCWGALGYKDSGSTIYGGYFIGHTDGEGKAGQANIGIGIGAWGDLMGADIHGKIYGLYSEGGNYAIFANGPLYRNNLDVHLQQDKSGGNTVLYTNVSTDVTVQTSGTATLSGGKAFIEFDPAFAASVSSEESIVVTVTPTGNSNGVYLAEVSKAGFSVVENNAGKSNVRVNYIAIGKRAGYEHPTLSQDVIDPVYTKNLARGLHDDGDLQTNGEGLYHENGKLVVGVHPSTLPDPSKPAVDPYLPKPGTPEKIRKDSPDGSVSPRQANQVTESGKEKPTAEYPSGEGSLKQSAPRTKTSTTQPEGVSEDGMSGEDGKPIEK